MQLAAHPRGWRITEIGKAPQDHQVQPLTTEQERVGISQVAAGLLEAQLCLRSSKANSRHNNNFLG